MRWAMNKRKGRRLVEQERATAARARAQWRSMCWSLMRIQTERINFDKWQRKEWTLSWGTLVIRYSNGYIYLNATNKKGFVATEPAWLHLPLRLTNVSPLYFWITFEAALSQHFTLNLYHNMNKLSGRENNAISIVITCFLLLLRFKWMGKTDRTLICCAFFCLTTLPLSQSSLFCQKSFSTADSFQYVFSKISFNFLNEHVCMLRPTWVDQCRTSVNLYNQTIISVLQEH